MRRTLQEIDEELVEQMRDHATAYAASTPIRRVAVVANAPLESSVERRDLIDTSDLVVRCNSLALDRHDGPPCVGTRTNVVVAARTTRPTPAFLQDYRNRAYFVVDVWKIAVPDPPGQPSHWPSDLGAWPMSNRVFGMPLKYLLRPPSGGFGVVPTTGTLAVYLAYRLFPEADIVLTGYSFLNDREQQHWGYHWEGLRQSPVHSAHKLDREAAYLQGLVDRGEVRYVA
ncbi:MAG: hypothetical protein ACRDV1_01320 [Actinomycetes bacterium]